MHCRACVCLCVCACVQTLSLITHPVNTGDYDDDDRSVLSSVPSVYSQAYTQQQPQGRYDQHAPERFGQVIRPIHPQPTPAHTGTWHPSQPRTQHQYRYAFFDVPVGCYYFVYVLCVRVCVRARVCNAAPMAPSPATCTQARQCSCPAAPQPHISYRYLPWLLAINRSAGRGRRRAFQAEITG